MEFEATNNEKFSHPTVTRQSSTLDEVMSQIKAFSSYSFPSKSLMETTWRRLRIVMPRANRDIVKNSWQGLGREWARLL